MLLQRSVLRFHGTPGFRDMNPDNASTITLLGLFPKSPAANGTLKPSQTANRHPTNHPNTTGQHPSSNHSNGSFPTFSSFLEVDQSPTKSEKKHKQTGTQFFPRKWKSIAKWDLNWFLILQPPLEHVQVGHGSFRT